MFAELVESQRHQKIRPLVGSHNLLAAKVIQESFPNTKNNMYTVYIYIYTHFGKFERFGSPMMTGR